MYGNAISGVSVRGNGKREREKRRKPKRHCRVGPKKPGQTPTVEVSRFSFLSLFLCSITPLQVCFLYGNAIAGVYVRGNGRVKKKEIPKRHCRVCLKSGRARVAANHDFQLSWFSGLLRLVAEICHATSPIKDTVGFAEKPGANSDGADASLFVPLAVSLFNNPVASVFLCMETQLTGFLYAETGEREREREREKEREKNLKDTVGFAEKTGANSDGAGVSLFVPPVVSDSVLPVRVWSHHFVWRSFF